MTSEQLTVVCAWCATVVREGGDQISHGICAPCAMDFLTRLPPEFLRSVADTDGTVSLFSGHRFALQARHPTGDAA